MINLPNHIIKPARYTGIEPNRAMKDLKDVSVRFALCYPDVYEVGMSYYGYFLLYELANSIEGVWCERCFAPWHDMDVYLRQKGVPLGTLESKTPLDKMDLVGFSLSYELNVTNVLNMLRLGNIPLKSQDRLGGPIIMGGGPLMLNPKPYELFFDLIVIGEGEGALLQILEAFKGLKGGDRASIVKNLADIEGVYSPLYRKEPVKRLYMQDLDSSYHALRPPIPVSGSIHNRLNIEISRGCGNGCRFCMAGFGYRPYRERSFENIKEIIDISLKNTGYEEVSLLSLSSGDYSALFQTISHIREHHKGVSVSLPSLKIGSISEDDIGALGDIARTGFTFALESASQAIRCMINKNIDIEILFKQLPLLRKYGWRRLKIYFMIGFPGENEADLATIKEIIRPFKQAGIDINLSVAPFTPKPHTPLQWLPMEDGQVLREKMAMLKMLMRKSGAKVKYRDIETSFIEGIISRGDASLAPLFDYLYERGAKLEAWREFFKPELYHEWFNENGLDIHGYLKGRTMKEPLPWDFIDTGIEKAFLMDEAQKAHRREMSTDCYIGCAGCGMGCTSEVRRKKEEVRGKRLEVNREQRGDGGGKMEEVGMDESPGLHPPSSITHSLSSIKEPKTKRLTLRYGKYGDARYLGHIDTMNILLRVLRSSGISIKMHGKYRPMPNIALSDALPVGIESMCELMEIEADGGAFLDRGVLKEMNDALPEGMKIYEIIEGRLKDVVKEYVYILIADEGERPEELKMWRSSSKSRFYLWKGKGIKLFWQRGDFRRIIKVEETKLHAL